MSQDAFSLTGKNIFITGASSGIGKAIAISSAKQGGLIHLSGRNEERLKHTLNELPYQDGKHTYIIGDLKSAENVTATCEQLPTLDGVVFNAGFTKTAPIKFAKAELVDDIFTINVQSSIHFMRQLLKKRKLKNGASVCFISSVATLKPTVGNAVYSASKGAVNALTQSLALELAPKKIRVNAVLPGFVNTNILQGSDIAEEQLEAHKARYPIGRFGEPDDVAHLVNYLLSDASSWMTGSLLKIDGGFSLK
jgi:NAD(P)-dependent dehydrogenase (short-subunit alcohol dehydrogenase family)